MKTYRETAGINLSTASIVLLAICPLPIVGENRGCYLLKNDKIIASVTKCHRKIIFHHLNMEQATAYFKTQDYLKLPPPHQIETW